MPDARPTLRCVIASLALAVVALPARGDPPLAVPTVGDTASIEGPPIPHEFRAAKRREFDRARTGPALVDGDGAMTGPLGGLDVPPERLPAYEEILLVNGVQTDPETAAAQAARTGDKLGAGVRLVYNASTCPFADYALALWDKMTSARWGANESTRVLLAELRSRASCGQPVFIIGHSEGAICVSNALWAYWDELLADGDLGDAERRARMHCVHVLTVGSAVLDERDPFADAWAPEIGSLYHVYHENDFIANVFGPGRITNWPTSFFDDHQYLSTYLPALEPEMLLESGTMVLEDE